MFLPAPRGVWEGATKRGHTMKRGRQEQWKLPRVRHRRPRRTEDELESRTGRIQQRCLMAFEAERAIRAWKHRHGHD
jgi:hypothetical protein